LSSVGSSVNCVVPTFLYKIRQPDEAFWNYSCKQNDKHGVHNYSQMDWYFATPIPSRFSPCLLELSNQKSNVTCHIAQSEKLYPVNNRCRICHPAVIHDTFSYSSIIQSDTVSGSVFQTSSNRIDLMFRKFIPDVSSCALDFHCSRDVHWAGINARMGGFVVLELQMFALEWASTVPLYFSLQLQFNPILNAPMSMPCLMGSSLPPQSTTTPVLGRFVTITVSSLICTGRIDVSFLQLNWHTCRSLATVASCKIARTHRCCAESKESICKGVDSQSLHTRLPH